MSYKVRMTDDKLTDHVTKHYMSRSQAIHGMRKLAYQQLAAFGKLDTQAAHDVMTAIDRCDDILSPQDHRFVKISNTGFHLVLRNTARSPR
jgi:hypothetical protein